MALKYSQEALEVYRRGIPNPIDRRFAMVLRNVCSLAARVGNIALSVDAGMEAVGVLRDLGEDACGDLQVHLRVMASLFQQTGNPELALAFLKEANSLSQFPS
jgi:hypothetical protein